MNTSSLQNMKMAARMSCLPSQTPQRWEYLLFKEGWSFQEWWRLVRKCLAGVSERPSKAINVRQVHGLKMLKPYKLCWRTLWTSLPTSTSLVFVRLSSVFLNELVLVSSAPCYSLNQGCKRFLKRFHASGKQNKTLFDTVSTGFDVDFLSCTCWLFIKKRLMRSEFWQLQSQWNWTLNVTNLEIARLCGSFTKKKYYRMDNFVQNCWEN